jgi:Trypsin-like peptidase domain
MKTNYLRCHFFLLLILFGTVFCTISCTKEPQSIGKDKIRSIASNISVRISWQESGSGFIVGREKKENGYAYHVLTTKHVVSVTPPDNIDVTNLTKEEIKSLEKTPGKVDPGKYIITISKEGQEPKSYEIKKYGQQVQKDESLDLAIITFYSSEDYAVAEMSSDINTKFSSYIYGFKSCQNKQNINEISEFNAGEILDSNSSDNNHEGYTTKYSNLSIMGMSGSPILNSAGQVIAIHGKRSKNNVKKGMQGNSSILSECLRIPVDFTPNYGIAVQKIMGSELAKKSPNKFGSH